MTNSLCVPDQWGRFKHLTGHVPRELAKHALTLLGSLPDPDFTRCLQKRLAGSDNAYSLRLVRPGYVLPRPAIEKLDII